MGMPASPYCTAADLLAMPEDGNTYEVVHGELLVTPSPRLLHQRMVKRLMLRLDGYLERWPIGEVFPGGDLRYGEDTWVLPDLLVLSPADTRENVWVPEAVPLLVVEVLSPSSARQDRFTKRRLYQEVAVPVYWLVDPDEQLVEVWTPEAAFPAVAADAIAWHPAGVEAPLVILLAELFRAVP